MNLLEEQTQLERFGASVLADQARHDQLRSVKDEGEFIALVVQWGAEHGYHFTAAIVQRTLNEKRRAWLERWV